MFEMLELFSLPSREDDSLAISHKGRYAFVSCLITALNISLSYSKEVKEREESVPIVSIFAASVNHIEVLIAPICISPG